VSTSDRSAAGDAAHYVRADHRYLYLITGDLLDLDPRTRAALGRRLAYDAAQIPDDQLRALFRGAWPERVTAAWLAGFDRRTRLRPLLADLLLAADAMHPVGAYCFTLARFAGPQDATILRTYLRRILPGAGPGPVAALAALLYLDSRLATAHATAFLNRHDRGGAGSTHQPLPGSDPRQQQRRLARLCAFADTHTASPPSVL
jgi:hypothetical protein